ncbi:MAG TPA: hypothetical protein VMJ70_15355 [Candidatus Sulfotelmatobacter sp.]|nr:hypothetical protein [Candidatus Sulfotelmatobacter sp.]
MRALRRTRGALALQRGLFALAITFTALAFAIRISYEDHRITRLRLREVGALGPGRHLVHLGDGARVPPGVYLLRLVQGNEVRHARAVVLQ